MRALLRVPPRNVVSARGVRLHGPDLRGCQDNLRGKIAAGPLAAARYSSSVSSSAARSACRRIERKVPSGRSRPPCTGTTTRRGSSPRLQVMMTTADVGDTEAAALEGANHPLSAHARQTRQGVTTSTSTTSASASVAGTGTPSFAAASR